MNRTNMFIAIPENVGETNTTLNSWDLLPPAMVVVIIEQVDKYFESSVLIHSPVIAFLQEFDHPAKFYNKSNHIQGT